MRSEYSDDDNNKKKDEQVRPLGYCLGDNAELLDH